MHHHALFDAAGADDRHLGRHDHEVGEPPADRSEVRQRDRRAAQLLGRNGARREPAGQTPVIGPIPRLPLAQPRLYLGGLWQRIQVNKWLRIR